MGLEDNETYFQVSRDGWLYQAYPRLFTLNIFHTRKVNKSDLAKLLCSYVSEWNGRGLELPCIMFVYEPYMVGKHALTNKLYNQYLNYPLSLGENV